MARKITVEDLVKEGVPEAQAKRIVVKMTQPAPREIWWQFKATEEVAAKALKAVREAKIEIVLVKRFKASAAAADKKE